MYRKSISSSDKGFYIGYSVVRSFFLKYINRLKLPHFRPSDQAQHTYVLRQYLRLEISYQLQV